MARTSRIRLAAALAALLASACAHRGASDEDEEIVRREADQQRDGYALDPGNAIEAPSRLERAFAEESRPPELPLDDEELDLPSQRGPKPPPRPPTQRRSEPRIGMLTWPLEVRVVTSRFGVRADPIKPTKGFHRGMDFRCAIGTPVYAAGDGQAVFAGWAGGRGNAIELWHSEALSTVYAHLYRVDVQVGQSVRAGQIIGYSGSTGRSTGPHLHFETWRAGQPVNPLAYRYRDPPVHTASRPQTATRRPW